jgi:hypothetical protein
MCGPSGQQKQIAGQAENLSSLLSANYAQNFGAESAILGHLTNILTPIVEAGPNQEGMSAAEKAAITGNAINTNATNYRNAATVVAGSRAGAGGSTYAPSGTDKQVAATIASNEAGQLSQEENQIEQADYALGRQEFQQAEAGLAGVAAAYNPNATAGAAIGANSAAAQQAEQMTEESNAWMGDVAGLAGGIGSTILGAKLGKKS